MDQKQLYDFLFELYDYADYLADRIQPNNPDNNNYFMSLIYIEEMMDAYGRGLINEAAHEIDQNDRDSLKEAHRRIDLLRQRINELRSTFAFDDVVTGKTQKLLRDWGPRSS